MTFKEALSTQRWDDHRFYHHNRINQSLHLVSAISFVSAYVLLFIEPALSVLIGWLIAMPTRQAGHFFFEPRGFDEPNQVSHEYKEEVKVGYNLRRKVWLMSIWILSPIALVVSPSCVGLLTPAHDAWSLIHNVSVLWLWIGIGGLLLRTVHLFFIMDVRSGLAWMTKILTDPFHDIALYHRAPLYVLRGEMFDPIVTEDVA